MAFNILSPSDISARLRGALRLYLPGTDALIFPNNLTAIIKTVAAGLHDMHLRAGWLYRQLFTTTADAVHVERHGAELGIYRRARSRALGRVTLSAAADTIYPAGIEFISGDRIYRSVSDHRSDLSGAITMIVQCDAFGEAGNIAAGETLARGDPSLFPALAATGTVDAGGIGGGAETESDADLRARVLDRKRRPPQGGAYSDYEQFAQAVPGVIKAWAYPFVNGPGTVGVWFTFAGRTNGIPNGGDIATVLDAIEAKRLIRVSVHVNAPIATPVNVTISGLSNDTLAIRAAIEAGLRAMFAARARPGVASSPFTLSRSWISEAISLAIGEDRHVLTSPSADLSWSGGQMPVLGTITYV